MNKLMNISKAVAIIVLLPVLLFLAVLFSGFGVLWYAILGLANVFDGLVDAVRNNYTKIKSVSGKSGSVASPFR